MKTVEKNGITLVYVDNNVMNSDKYAANFSEGDDAPNAWMVETNSTESFTALMSKEAVYKMLMDAYERVSENNYHEEEDPEDDDSQVRWCAKMLLDWP